jgi:hypothetical protein
MAKAEKGSEDTLKELRRQIQIGLDQADCGELLDGEMVFEELEQQPPAERSNLPCY